MTWLRWGLFLLTFGGAVVVASGAGWVGIKLLLAKDAAGHRRPLTVCLGLLLLLVAAFCAGSILDFFD